MKAKRIGLMGGTFDPVHNGHLMAAEAARDEFSLDKVWFVPTGKPPHKTKLITDSVHRIKMLELAIKSNPYFDISTIETDRPGTTYTYDTMNLLYKQYPSGYTWHYIIGSDTLRELNTWKSIEKVSLMCSFIVYRRPYEIGSNDEENIKKMVQNYNMDINFVRGPVTDISSSDIRLRLSQGRSIRYLVPDSVLDYIYYKGLYMED